MPMAQPANLSRNIRHKPRAPSLNQATRGAVVIPGQSHLIFERLSGSIVRRSLNDLTSKLKSLLLQGSRILMRLPWWLSLAAAPQAPTEAQTPPYPLALPPTSCAAQDAPAGITSRPKTRRDASACECACPTHHRTMRSTAGSSFVRTRPSPSPAMK